ncbi:helix-turn-helix domain-containing protein [bacterium]|nr:helix-turn-helix domain-containing protein [bacterium]
MGYNEKELLGKVEKEKNEKQEIVLPPKKETIGDILKKKREESGKTIEYISDYLRIKSQYLKALEENNFNSLPGQAYVIGFIKSYATFLNIPDVQKLINQYKSENNPNSSDVLKISDENSIMEDPIINSNHIIFGSILIILGVFLIYIFTNKSKETQNIVAPSQNELAQNEVSNDNLQTEEVEIVIPSSLEKSSEENDKQEETLTPVNNKEEKVEEPTAQTINLVNFVYDNEQQSVSEEIVELPTHTPREYGLKDKNTSQIKLVAKDNVWIKLKKDGFYKYDSENGDVGTGESVFETILENGDIYYIPDEENLYLTIGNAQGVDIIVNGEAIKPLSPRPISRHNIEMNAEKLQNGTAYIRKRIIE